MEIFSFSIFMNYHRQVKRRKFLESLIAGTSLLLIPRGSFSFLRTELILAARGVRAGTTFPSASRMATAAEVILKSLSTEQRGNIIFSLGDNERQEWDYVPRSRAGVPLKQLDPAQRQLVTGLLSSGLSEHGFKKASTIMSLETILRELEGWEGRDPELYYLTLFGQPQSNEPWGWRFEGHHLSLNFTIVSAEQIAITPFFFGSNPAEVQHGPHKGLRALAGEEDFARALLKSLDAEQRRLAVISNSAPQDILSGRSRKADPLTPAGIHAAKLSEKQKDILMSLLIEYLSSMAPDIAAVRLEGLRSAGFGSISFAWAGNSERGQPHYYRIQGPSFLIEYDNIQNNANHIHSVWRDFNGDFGLDLLAEHYRDSHH